METTLYGDRLSPFVEKVARALQLKGVAFRLVKPTSPMDLKKWNPTTGKMPVLEVDGERVFDSTFICRRLDEIVAEPSLYGADERVAAKQRFLEDWADESLYWYTMAFRWAPENERLTVAQLAPVLPAFVRPLAGVLLPRVIGSSARAQGLGRLPLKMLVDQLASRLDELVVLLDGKPFFYADRPSVGDLALYGQISTMRSGPTPQCEDLLGDRRELLAWYQRVEQATEPRTATAVGSGRRAA